MRAAQLFHGELHLHGTQQRAPGMVARRCRIAVKHRHDRIPHKLVDRPEVAKDDVAHGGEAAVQHAEHPLDRVRLGNRRKAAQVGEKDGRVALRVRRGAGRYRQRRRGERVLDALDGLAVQGRALRFAHDVLDQAQRVAVQRCRHPR